jgi:hypothetical protein
MRASGRHSATLYIDNASLIKPQMKTASASRDRLRSARNPVKVRINYLKFEVRKQGEPQPLPEGFSSFGHFGAASKTEEWT